uniref:pseudouridine-metabolizing bifunctional protein C1861.05 isoform X2 n=1 Tax=Scatophagus argus TaxID=75038 RepID=UPI001ED7FFF7|nr:pseudouridine-metabolizing bifunctional protein C1861.05 isoform X2 [Scatophagus argus]
MISVPFFCFCLAAGLAMSSSLRTLDSRSGCNEQGLGSCNKNNCSDKRMVVGRQLAPTGPDLDPEHVGVWMDKHRLVPVMNLTWTLQADASVLKLRGSEISILDDSTNQSMCVQFSYLISQQQSPQYERWKFSLYGVVVEPGHTYVVSVLNLPEPDIGDYRIKKQITIPGCDDKRIQEALICLQNGSLWDPHMTTNVSVDKEHKMLSILLVFEAAQYSERYQVSIQSHGFHYSKNVTKENRTSLNVTFEVGLWQLSQCEEMSVMIQPFFIRCKNACWRPKKIINYCNYDPPRTLIIKATVMLLVVGSYLTYLLWRTSHKDTVNTASSVAREQQEGFQVQERKRVLIIYSLDHPLYKNIVLKLCAFLATKCGTEVILDLLDSTKLGVLGRIQWLDWHREQIERSSDKILILCSRGVQAKWRSMCGAKQVFLREDAHSSVGDMLSPALSLIVPHFIRSLSFEKYMVAYFDDVCSEDDVPSPFKITVRYTLMKHFEELFFRILDTEKHEPGRMNHIEGLSEDQYYHCPSGLRNRMSMMKRAYTFLLRRGITTYQNGLFRVHPSVKQALAENKPVVALESTIITHGMPYPHNLSTAKEVEAIVREEGATPATVGVIEGEVHVGLSSEELDHLARCKSSVKVSRRDLPYVISKGLSGGTTVSATMIAAHRAGIPVFVTGGIGGVHRDGENSLDISADLTELGRTPIAVVSAGIKSILDIGRTLEFLETQGVCVATYGALKSFPAFFSPQSGFTSPYQVCNPEEAAKLIASTLSLGLQSGVLLAVPIPEEHAAAGQQIEEAIQAAVAEASANGITGRDVTPFILQKVNELTKGKSLQANIALIHNNAKVGSQIACALSKQLNEKRLQGKTPHQRKHSSGSDIIVIGGINVDFIAKGKSKTLRFGQTNTGSVCQSFGGVGRNIADSLSRLGRKPLFISATGRDSHGDAVFNYCKHMNTSGVARLEGQSTATYCVVIAESGEMSLGLGDMDIHQQITEQYVSQFEKQLSSAPLVCLDGNIPVSTIDYVCSIASEHNINVWYEPTDSEKACKPFLSDSWKSLSYSSPNLAELCTMNKTLGIPTPEVLPNSLDEVLSVAVALSRPLLEHIHCLVVTLGDNGLLLCGEHESGSVNLQPRKQKRGRQLCALHYPALTVTAEETVNVSGAGDSLAGALIAGILQQRDTDSCARMGLLAARLSLTSPHPIAPMLTLDSVDPSKFQTQDWPKPSFMWIH